MTTDDFEFFFKYDLKKKYLNENKNKILTINIINNEVRKLFENENSQFNFFNFPNDEINWKYNQKY